MQIQSPKNVIESFSPTEVYPGYSQLSADWLFFLDAYESSVSEYVDKYLVKNNKEGDDEFELRKNLAYKENHCRQIINLFNSHLFKEKPSRIESNSEAKTYWSRFSNDCDGKGTDINLFMRDVDKYSSALGRVYIVMDRKIDDSATGTHLDDISSQHYMYIVKPYDIPKVAFDDYGNIKWIVIREVYFDDDNPFTDDTMTPKIRYRLWTNNYWYLYYADDTPMESGSHGVGICPVFYIDNAIKSNKYDGLSLINEAAYIDKSIFNNISRLNTIIEDQTFSQLVMPVEAVVMSDEDAKEEAITTSTKRVLLFSANAGANAKPGYISPDASQAKLILEVIEKQIRQLYNSLGLQSENTGTTGDSGSAKEYDYSRLNSYLTSKAERLEELEKKIVLVLSKWMSTNLQVEVIYPNSFDIRTLQNEILYAQELALLKISDTFQKELHKRIVKKALPKASQEISNKIEDEIDKSNPFDPDGMIDIEKEAMLADINISKKTAEEEMFSNTSDNGNKNTADRLANNDKGGHLRSEQNKITNL